ncbi:hypothetical protein DES53_103265 [Roseimicrobium gellanilyticum]|uniref:Fibronectin type III domain protein n=1 Tax=Roseimicrobium gellanilyticum TaxID=748857 RepID=A0A366HP47_9BACT|nr:hypothetical protein [Roseimicrobium gellanilyticum]RBP45267.1 hypothetical protein DES53_103265 [Roseimicrobium gellanilyticum]
MEWFYLALLAPFILVPVVLLFGYAGCGKFGVKHELTLTHTIDGTTVTLTWTAGPVGTMRYQISRGEEGEDIEQISTAPSTQTQYADTGRPELAKYFYTVIALNGENDEAAKSNQLEVDIPLLAPSNLKAVAIEANKVRLTWTNDANSRANRNVVHRFRAGTTTDFVDTDIARAEAHEDVTPSAATDFSYQIASRLVEAGTSGTSIFVPPTPVNVETTTPPPPVENPVLVFPATPAPPPTRESSNVGDCLIQRFPSEQLRAGGNRLRVTFRAAPNGLGFKRVTVSQPARSGDDFDSHTDLKTIETNFDLSATGPTVRTVDYVLDPAQDLLIAFDVKDNAGMVPVVDGVAGCTVYQQDNTAQADSMERSGFRTFNNTLVIVEKIEVV